VSMMVMSVGRTCGQRVHDGAKAMAGCIPIVWPGEGPAPSAADDLQLDVGSYNISSYW